MTFTQIKRAVGLFPNHAEAEQALTQLRNSGFSLDQVSILATDKNGKIGGNNLMEPDRNKANEGAKTGAIAGSAAGGLVGLIEGLAVLAIPGVGPAVALGTVLANTLISSGIGAAAGGLGGALAGWSIPEEDAKFYSDRVSKGDFLLIVEAPENELRRAESILKNRRLQQWRTYDVSRNAGHSQMNIISQQPGIDS